jgi:hypothetical protein
MQIKTEPVDSNTKSSNARTVMSTVYAAMLTLTSAIMIQSSPEAAQIFTANPVASAAVVSLAIVGALKFINKTIDAMLLAEDEDLVAAPVKCSPQKLSEQSNQNSSCSTSDEITEEMDRLAKDKSITGKGPTHKGPTC